MTLQHRNILRSNLPLLVEDGIPDELLTELMSKNVISRADYAKIKEVRPDHKQMAMLVWQVARKSDDAFHKFCEALQETQQDHLANALVEYETDYKDEDYPAEVFLVKYPS